MSRLPTQKRNQLVLASLIIAIVIIGLWYTLIQYQQDELHKLALSKAAVEGTLAQIRNTIKSSKEIDAELSTLSEELARREEDMASGDLYSSMVNLVRKFKLQHKVEIPKYDSTGVASDVNLLPKFPYKQFTLSISGTANFYDLGRFIADFENDFPTSRILNLDVSPASSTSPEDKEKLSFRMDIVSLVKSGGATPALKP